MALLTVLLAVLAAGETWPQGVVISDTGIQVGGDEVWTTADARYLYARGTEVTDPDARLVKHPFYMEYTGCGNFRCGLIDMNGATAFLH